MASAGRQDMKAWTGDDSSAAQVEGTEQGPGEDSLSSIENSSESRAHDVGEAFSGEEDKLRPEPSLQAAGSPAPAQSSEAPLEEKKEHALDSEELGTGYEEDTERGALSSEASTDMSDRDQSGSFFKPVEPKNADGLTIDDIRASKLNKKSNPDSVKAPGVVGRAKEEVDAVTENVMETLNLKEKRSTSGDQKEATKKGGFFSRIAEKMGYGGHGRSQSQ